MKKMTKMVLLLLLIVASVMMVTACDDKPSNIQGGQISVEKSGMPQTVFVLGEELDLSNGVLTVKNGDQTEQIALNAEGITVTGYDKNKLGEQTITIAYGGNSTELKITVVERMQMVEHVTDYMVGDALDTSVGRLKITRNDGSNYTVLLGSDGVEISGFDSAKAGAQNVTAKYTNDGVSYTCQFTVNVHAVENVEFHAPKKLNYNSHDEGLDLTDGYFTLSANGGALTKTVALTEDMISGFDLSAVNAGNSPLTQNLSASYGGQAYQYEIKLVYTNISLFKEQAAAFADMDWSNGNVPEYTDEMGEKALELMEIFLDLSKADWTHIPMEESINVARVALLYGMDRMDPDFIALEGAFTITGGALDFTCESREAVEQALEVLENEDGEIYRISPILLGVTEVFADEEVVSEMYFADFNLLPVDIYEELADMFEHMLDVHDALLDIPEDWQEVGVETYADEIEAFYASIFGGEYVDSGMAYIYGYVSNWRTTGDAFDILYHYYYGKGDQEALNALAKVNLPTSLSELAYHITEMLSQIDLIGDYGQMDTTLMMYHYYSAVRLSEQLKNGDDEMARNLYYALPVNALMGMDDSTLFDFDMLLEYIKINGFYQFSGGLLGIDAYHELMDAYMAFIMNILDDDTYEYSDRYNADLEAIFDMFINLRPTQQYYFLNTLNAFYSMSIPPLAFDDTGEFAELMTLFTIRIHEYYRGNLPDASDAYTDLMIAIEIYAQRSIYENWVDAFNGRMAAVDEAYEAMNAEEKAAFDRYLGKAYSKYTEIRERFAGQTEFTDLGEWADEFAALDEALLNVEIAATYIQKGYPMHSMFLSAYERAQIIVDNILANAPEHILKAYNFENRSGLDENGEVPEGAVLSSYEYLMTTYRTMYVNCLLTAMGSSIYDGYIASDMPGFLNQIYDVSWTYIRNTEDTPLSYDKAKVLAAMKTFSQLTLDEQVMFVLLEGEHGSYYTALDEFMMLNCTDAAYELGIKLLELEQAYIMYRSTQSEEDLALMQSACAEAKAMHEALSAEDLASFADFEELYSFYITNCENIAA